MKQRDIRTDNSEHPPSDPRESWDLPPIGKLTRVAVLDDVTIRVLAPNAGPMTLDGTNTYIVGLPSQRAVIVDPGPEDHSHLEMVRRVVSERDVTVKGIFVTHRHRDHAAAAAAWASEFDVPIISGSEETSGQGGVVVGDGSQLDVEGVGGIEVVATPGHIDDHLSLRLPTGALLVGDHILGRGTSVISRNGGNLTDYLESLRKVHRLGPDALFPGHGPELVEDPTAVVDYYLAHRHHRLDQILSVLADGPLTVEDIVKRLYPELGPDMAAAAAHSVIAAVRHLESEGLLPPGSCNASGL
ncbi:MAG: MBL fold metallo-hydrolase [Nitriliruptoraceae bacterium]